MHCAVMTRRFGRVAMAVAVGLTLAGCSSTLANLTDKDPEMERPGAFPNINQTGGQPPGKLMTPEEQAKARADLDRRAAQASARSGARVAAKQNAAGDQLQKRAATHGEDRVRELECGAAGADDATKCPQ